MIGENGGVVMIDYLAVEFHINGSIVAILDTVVGAKSTLDTLATERGYTYVETLDDTDIYKSDEGNRMHISPYAVAEFELGVENGRDG